MSTIAATILEMLPNGMLYKIFFEHLTLMWRTVCRSVCQRWRHLLLEMMPTKGDDNWQGPQDIDRTVPFCS